MKEIFDFMKEIVQNVYHLGDSGCSVYMINTESKDGLVLIDCGMSLDMIRSISKNGFDPINIQHCILTHFHIDHTAACHDLYLYNKNVKFYAHELDADAIEEKGHESETAASWYGINYQPIKLEKRLKGDKEILKFGAFEFECIHTPGHTPGSISIVFRMNDTTILFGQDIHGPFMANFRSNLEHQCKNC